MEKPAAALLSEEQFWAAIENSNQGRDLESQLAKLSADEIFGFRYWWIYFHRQSYNQALYLKMCLKGNLATIFTRQKKT